MADISMCMNSKCPRRLACVRHVDAGVYEQSQRQSFGGFSYEDGQCRSFIPISGLRSTDALYATVTPETWAAVDAHAGRHEYISAGLELGYVMAWKPADTLAVLLQRLTHLRYPEAGK